MINIMVNVVAKTPKTTRASTNAAASASPFSPKLVVISSFLLDTAAEDETKKRLKIKAVITMYQ